MTAYQQAMRAEARALEVSGTLTLDTGREIALTGADVVSLHIDEGVEDSLLIGAVLSAKHTLKLAGADGAWLPGGARLKGGSLRGATVRLFIGAGGETAPLCTFIVREAEGEKGAACVTLSGYDSMDEETCGSFEDTLSYPATLGAVIAHIVGKTRFTPPASVPNGDAVIEARPDWGNCAVRQALGWALALAGCYARVSRAGAFEVLPVYPAEAQADEIGGAATLRRVYGFADFGPLEGLKATSVRAAGGEGEPEEIEVRGAATEVLTSKNALHLGANPLLIAGSARGRALLAGTLGALAGLTLSRASFRFRGDPTLTVGTPVTVDGTTSTLTRQKLTLEKGFFAECELGAPEESGNTLRAITPEGGLNAARLTGTVDGALLAAESVAAGAIRAGSVTAQKLAAGAVTADKLAAGAVTAEKLDAQSVEARVAQIARTQIGQAVIGTAQIADAAVESAKIADAAVTAAKIARAAIGAAQIGDAAISSAKIALGAITTALIEDGAVGTAQIADGSITEAKIVSLNADVITAGTLSVDRLLLQGANGLFHAVNATDAGLTVEELSEEQYQNAISGTVLAARSVTAEKIAARTITANEIAASAITADEVNVNDLFASEAAIAILNTYDIRNDDCITLSVNGERRTYLRVRAPGVEIGEENSANYVQITPDALNIVQRGAGVIAYFAKNLAWMLAAEVRDYLRIGQISLRWSDEEGLIV